MEERWDSPLGGETAIEISGHRAPVGTALLLGASLAFLFGLLGFLLFRGICNDDAFITFVYARNFASGLGPVFNPGEGVEGYSNFLWMLLLSAIHALGGDIVTGAQVMGTVAVWVTLLAVWRLWPGLRTARLGVFFFLLLSPGLWVYATTGLETTAFTALFTLAVLGAFAFPERPVIAGLLGGLGLLCRPEGVLILPAAAGAIFVAARRPWRAAISVLGTGALFLALQLAFRRYHYGDWLPNTYYAKVSSITLAERIGLGWRYLLASLPKVGFMPLLGLLPFVLWRRALALCRITALISAGWLAAVVWMGGDHFYCARFLLPILPLAALAFFEETARLLLPRIPPERRLLPLPLLGVLLGALSLTQTDDLQRRYREISELRDAKILATFLDRYAEPGDALAIGAIGYVGYHTKLRIIDMYGLIDRHIARFGKRNAFTKPGHLVGDEDYVLARRPRFIHPSFSRSYQNLLHDERFLSTYQQIRLEFPDRMRKALWVRKDRFLPDIPLPSEPALGPLIHLAPE